MDRRDDHEGEYEDLYSGNGDDMELRMSMNLADLSMSSLQSEFSASTSPQFAGSDGGEELEEGDRDSQGRLRLSMIMSTASENEEDRNLDTLLQTTDGNESKYFEQSGNGDKSESRDGESDEAEPDDSDKVLGLSTEEDVIESHRGDTANEAEPAASVNRLKPRDAVDSREGEYRDHIPQSPQRAERTQEQSDGDQLPGNVEPEGITGEDYHQLPERSTTNAQSFADRTNEELRDAAEGDSSGYAQVKPTSSSPVNVDSKEEELRQASSFSDDQESQRKSVPQSGDVHRDVLGQSGSRDSPTQGTEGTKTTPVLAALALLAVDHNDRVAVSPLPPKPHPTPSYKIRDLFPVVYEKPTISQKKSGRTMTMSTKGQERRSPIHLVAEASLSATILNSSTKEQKATHRASPQRKEQQCIQSLHKHLEVTQRQLKGATQSIKMHQIAGAEKKQLVQRNARIKQQLDALTADLQRTKAENAKLHAENEVYSAKLPQLHAELLQESSQADEKQAQAVQLQLAMTQLKARVHVLQTRNGNLETQNEKLQVELRECRKELQRKTATLLVNTEKLSKLDADMSSLKSVHAQETLHWKAKLVTVAQRSELEKAKRDSELRRKTEHQLGEAKAQAASAAKKKRELEVTVMKFEDEIKQSKRKLDSGKQELLKQVKETLKLENLLKQAHQTEATLRNEVAVLKTKLRVSADEQKKQADWSLTQTRRRLLTTRQHPSGRQHGDKLLYPLDLLLLEIGTEGDGDDDDDVVEKVKHLGHHSKCCTMLLSASPSSRQRRHQHEDESDPESWKCSPSRQGQPGRSESLGSKIHCQECAKARHELLYANAEIHRLRLMHATELKVQMATYNHILQLGSRGLWGATGSYSASDDGTETTTILGGASSSA